MKYVSTILCDLIHSDSHKIVILLLLRLSINHTTAVVTFMDRRSTSVKRTACVRDRDAAMAPAHDQDDMDDDLDDDENDSEDFTDEETALEELLDEQVNEDASDTSDTDDHHVSHHMSCDDGPVCTGSAAKRQKSNYTAAPGIVYFLPFYRSYVDTHPCSHSQPRYLGRWYCPLAVLQPPITPSS